MAGVDGAVVGRPVADGLGVADGFAVGLGVAGAEDAAFGVADGAALAAAPGWIRLFHQSSITPACCTPPAAAPVFGVT